MNDTVQPPTPEQGPPWFDFATASEAERWAYDCGREDAFDPAKLTMDDVRDALELLVAALTRLAGETAEFKKDLADRGVVELPDSEDQS